MAPFTPLPYHLLTTFYNNGPQLTDASIKFGFYLCTSKIILATSTMPIETFQRQMNSDVCLKLELTPTKRQYDASHARVTDRFYEADLSDTEKGFTIPLNKDTYRFCWKRLFLYALVYSTQTKPYQVPIVKYNVQ